MSTHCPEPNPATSQLALQEVWMHRDYLLRVARRKLHDGARAEDAVHDVFEAVLSGKAIFSGRSSLRTWLTGVLLHKVTDAQRLSMRYCSFGALGDGQDDDDWEPECGLLRPEEHLELREQADRVLAGVARLPAALRDVIWKRAIHEESTESVCRQLGITPDAMFVRLHRARRQLAAAL